MNKLAILGPENSFSHLLAKKLRREIIFCETIEDVFKIVGENTDGLVPIENLIHGSVRDTNFCLEKYKSRIIKGIDMKVRLCLVSKSQNFNKIISKKEALSQCTNFLRKVNKKTEVADSTSSAIKTASEDENYAAIGSEDAAESFGLKILNKNIEDKNNNMTRFILLSKKENNEKKTRTSLLICPKKDRLGLLVDILAQFKKNNINLTKIESIPTTEKIGEYKFFLEIEATENSDELKSVFDNLSKENNIISFGSYNISFVE